MSKEKTKSEKLKESKPIEDHNSFEINTKDGSRVPSFEEINTVIEGLSRRDAVRALRDEFPGLTQESIANCFDITKASVSQILSGKRGKNDGMEKMHGSFTTSKQRPDARWRSENKLASSTRVAVTPQMMMAYENVARTGYQGSFNDWINEQVEIASSSDPRQTVWESPDIQKKMHEKQLKQLQQEIDDMDAEPVPDVKQSIADMFEIMFYSTLIKKMMGN